MKFPSSTSFALLGAALIAISYGLARFAFGLFVPPIRDDLDLAPDVIGIIGALPLISFVFATMVAPLSANRLGARNTAMASGIFGVVGLALISQATGAVPRHWRCPVWYLHGPDDACAHGRHAGAGQTLPPRPGQLGDERGHECGCHGRCTNHTFPGRCLALCLRVLCGAGGYWRDCHLVLHPLGFTCVPANARPCSQSVRISGGDCSGCLCSPS